MSRVVAARGCECKLGEHLASCVGAVDNDRSSACRERIMEGDALRSGGACESAVELELVVGVAYECERPLDLPRGGGLLAKDEFVL